MTVAMSENRQYRVMGVSVNNEFERMWKEKKSWPNWGTMPADARRNWEKPVKEPVALFIEPKCPTCRQELYLGCPAHWAVTGRNDLAHKSETQGQQQMEH